MGGMMLEGLGKPGLLESRDQAAVFLGTAVGGAMEFIGEHAEQHGRAGEQVQRSGDPETGKEQGADHEHFPVPRQERAFKEGARSEMVFLVRPDGMAQYRPFGISVPVLEPVDEAGKEIGEEQAAQN
jgi:hypothetical protein